MNTLPSLDISFFFFVLTMPLVTLVTCFFFGALSALSSLAL
nr:MAG TPA_asm: hypothetical protein [Caudoviricetes sp.]